MIEFILFFSLLLLVFTWTIKVNIVSLKMINLLLILYFILNLSLWIFWFQNDINTHIFWYNIFHISTLESFFLVIFWIVWIWISLYSQYYFSYYLEHKKNLNFYYIMMITFIIAMQAVIISSNALVFLVVWEIMTISSYFLVIHDYKQNQSFEWGNYYLIIAHIGMFFILLSFIPFIIQSGSFDFVSWSQIWLSENYKNIVFYCALIWFWWKAGIWPLDIWLPKAHPIAPSNISAFMSGFMVKLPILMILKFIIIFFGFQVHLNWWITLLIIWSISAFLWIFYALTQNHIKRILAFSTIENIGFIITTLWVFIIGLSLHNTVITILWFTALLYHIVNHAFYKTLLFMIAWSIIERTGNTNISHMWWYIKLLPFIWIISLFWILTIAWVPPFASFHSEITWMMWIISIIHDSWNIILQFSWVFAIILISMMSIFAFITFTKLYTIVFVWRPRDIKWTVNTQRNIYENMSYIFFLFFIVIVSLFPGIFSYLAEYILSHTYRDTPFTLFQLNDSNFIPAYLILIYIVTFYIWYRIYRLYLWNIKKIDPWNCWYPDIPHRSQYSPRWLVQPMRRLYESLYMQVTNLEYNEFYKQKRNKIKFVKSKKYLLEIVYNKWIECIVYISMKIRSLQNGILQYYIWYLFWLLVMMLCILYFYI